MTNEHVLEEAMKTAGQLGVIRDDGLWFPVFQVYFNKPSDLAILLTKELFSALAGLVFDNTHFTAGTQVTTYFLQLTLLSTYAVKSKVECVRCLLGAYMGVSFSLSRE